MSVFLFEELMGKVGQYFTIDFMGAEVLTEAERALLPGQASQKRIMHFSTGRFCARQALTQIGLHQQEILRQDKRQPLWPNGVAGSISHSAKMAGAMVCLNNFAQAVGLDIETVGGVTPEMWRLLFTANEQQFLIRQNEADTILYTTLFFSLKESFYKMQYPLLQAEPDFLDVEVQFKENHLTMQTGLFKADDLSLHWKQHQGQVVTVILLHRIRY